MPPLLCLALLLASGCHTLVDGPRGHESIYVDIRDETGAGGIGISANNITAMTDRMMRDMLTNPVLANAGHPPVVVMNEALFTNRGHEPLDKRLIVDRLRVQLFRAAAGRMHFVTAAPSAADGHYQLIGAIKAQSSVNPRTGTHCRYHQITFEMVSSKNQQIVWAGMYEFQKMAREDVIYL